MNAADAYGIRGKETPDISRVTILRQPVCASARSPIPSPESPVPNPLVSGPHFEVTIAANRHPLTLDRRAAERIDDPLGHRFRDFNERESVGDLDRADVR